MHWGFLKSNRQLLSKGPHGLDLIKTTVSLLKMSIGQKVKEPWRMKGD